MIGAIVPVTSGLATARTIPPIIPIGPVPARYANYLPPPDCRLVRLTDGAGGWMWVR
jgi:hypothetical protein